MDKSYPVLYVAFSMKDNGTDEVAAIRIDTTRCRYERNRR